MSGEVTIVGRLAYDPELRFVSNGKAVVRFTVMTSRSKRLDDGTWEDVDVTGWVCSAWDKLAENIAESLVKGDPVVVIGNAATHSWDADGEKKSRIEVTAKTVGVDLKRGPAKRDRNARPTAEAQAPVVDPWASPTVDDVPPF